MSLISTMEALMKRRLTPEESTTLAAFQKSFAIDDEDPLIVVLAMMARSQLILESMPILLQQKSDQTIELHRNVLRDQSVLISKELIAEVAKHVQGSGLSRHESLLTRWLPVVACFAGGFACFLAGWLVRYH